METGVQHEVSYRYDELGRLIAVGYTDGEKVAYTYDVAGNRTRVRAGEFGDEAVESVAQPTRAEVKPILAPPRTQARPPDATVVSMPVEPQQVRPAMPPRPPERPPEMPESRPSPPARPPVVALCSSCQAPLPPGARFCAVCGTPVGTAPQPASPAVCAACGKPLEPGTRFCRWCGSKVVS